MAVARVASGHIAGASFDAAGAAVDTTINIGTCDFLIVSVSWGQNNGHTVSGVTWDQGGTNQAMTAFGAMTTAGATLRKHSFYLANPTNGNLVLRVDPSTGASLSAEMVIDWESFSGVDVGGTPFDGYNTATATDGSAPFESALTITSATDDMVWVSHATRASGGDPSAIAPTNYTERHETLDGPLAVSSGDAAGAASVATTATFTSAGFSLLMNAHGVNLNAAAGGASAATTGTLATGTRTQADIVAGGLTIILTLTGDTWVAAGATFDAIRDDIIAGLDAASSPATGWNTLVRDTLAVTTVVRTSDTIVTITLPAYPTYAITADEVITCTIPAAALTGAVEVVSSPTITIHEGVVLSAYAGTTNGSGVLTTSLTSDQASVRTLTRSYVNGTEVGRITTLPA